MWTWPTEGISFGGDYNPEQWPREVWDEDVALMREAGVNLVSVGIFSWALLEPDAGAFDFGWLDRVLDLLHAAGIRGRPGHARPRRRRRGCRRAAPRDRCRSTADGRRLWHGSRQAFCPSSPDLPRAVAATRRAAGRRATATTRRWRCGTSTTSTAATTSTATATSAAVAFRELAAATRYGDRRTALNDAWGTAFWSQRYTDWDEVIPPRPTPTRATRPRQLDFRRFSSDAVLALLRAPSATCCTGVTPDGAGHHQLHGLAHTRGMDYWAWAPEQDVVSNDHYVDGRLDRPRRRAGLVGRRLAQPRSPQLRRRCRSRHAVDADGALDLRGQLAAAATCAKAPGQLGRNSLGARGARRRRHRCSSSGGPRLGGAEKFHSGDAAARRHRHPGLARGGRARRACSRGCPSCAARSSPRRVAVALRLAGPVGQRARLVTRRCSSTTTARATSGTPRCGTPASPSTWSRQMPTSRRTPLWSCQRLYSCNDSAAANIAAAARGGAQVVITYSSGIVDEHEQVRPGGYPGAFRELLGVRTEEFFPLRAGRDGAPRRRHDRERLDRAHSPRRRDRRGVVHRRAGGGRPGDDPARRRRR